MKSQRASKYLKEVIFGFHLFQQLANENHLFDCFQAADKTDNPSLAKFLRARAQVSLVSTIIVYHVVASLLLPCQAFLDNQYSESDRLWLDVDSR